MAESKQIGILRYIYETQTEKGYVPTIRDIGEQIGLSSTSTVFGHISRLKKNGYLLDDPDNKRAMRVTDLGLKQLGVSKNRGFIPVAGVVTAGQPILVVEQEATDFFPLPENLSRFEGELMMLDVQGNSMINVGILDKDRIVVRKQDHANNGDIVVAMTDDFGGENEVTVKRFFKEDGHYRLQPENDSMDPIIVQNVQIVGKVVGLWRDNF